MMIRLSSASHWRSYEHADLIEVKGLARKNGAQKDLTERLPYSRPSKGLHKVTDVDRHVRSLVHKPFDEALSVLKKAGVIPVFVPLSRCAFVDCRFVLLSSTCQKRWACFCVRAQTLGDEMAAGTG